MNSEYDFANILLAGPCNQRCPYCIGRHVDPRLNRSNLDEYPLRNVGAFVGMVRRHGVRQVVLTGTNTDPQLYRHEERLVRWLREQLPDTRISLHTNGQLALSRMDVVNLYDRVTVSFPSFNPDTFERMAGTRRVPDLAAIVSGARVPVKVSCVVTEHNAGEVGEFVARCHETGVRRLVLRKEYGRSSGEPPLDPASLLADQLSRPGWTLSGTYRHAPVYDYRGIEITCWDFEQTTSTSLNLFADGAISSEYLLTRARASHS